MGPLTKGNTYVGQARKMHNGRSEESDIHDVKPLTLLVAVPTTARRGNFEVRVPVGHSTNEPQISPDASCAPGRAPGEAPCWDGQGLSGVFRVRVRVHILVRKCGWVDG